MPGLDIFFKRRRQQPYSSRVRGTEGEQEEEEWLCQPLPFDDSSAGASELHTFDPAQQYPSPVEDRRESPEKQRRYLKKKKPTCTKTWGTNDTRQYFVSGFPWHS